MDRAFVITGLLFGIMIILLVAANYNVLTKTQHLETNTQNIKIDKVYNSYIDLKRALSDAKSDGQVQDPSKCNEYMTSVLNNPLFDTDGVVVTGTVNGCTATFTVESSDGAVHKEG
jgi:hypothetical protein